LYDREIVRSVVVRCYDYVFVGCISLRVMLWLCTVNWLSSEQSVTEEEIRELLTDYVERQGCWGGRPADKWPISKIEDCNVYIGTLETFIEERDVERLVKSYTGGAVNDKADGHAPGAWEIDMRHEFPLLFTQKKLARQKIPSSESVKTCGGMALKFYMWGVC
jgi:hypothetical protein